MQNLLMTYLILINLATFIVYGVDKAKAKAGAWRISEKMLILLALVGGSFGALAGMAVFRHKTRHAKFAIGVPLILAVQLAILSYFGVISW